MSRGDDVAAITSRYCECRTPDECDRSSGCKRHYTDTQPNTSSAASPSQLFANRDEYEIGKEYGRGWLVLRPAENGVRLAVGERGLGHDEPSKLHGFALTFSEAAELRDALSVIVPPETEPTETHQWHAPVCDGCGEPIRNANDRNAGSYRVRGLLGHISERSGTWHRACTPKAFYERWGKW